VRKAKPLISERMLPSRSPPPIARAKGESPATPTYGWATGPGGRNPFRRPTAGSHQAGPNFLYFTGFRRADVRKILRGLSWNERHSGSTAAVGRFLPIDSGVAAASVVGEVAILHHEIGIRSPIDSSNDR
jgi:hypothetical protein